ncbi:MAG: M48 family metalloprotease [Desulfurococcales archaeon]|nr:M48 family metalloprotease [Desulfurococcales archaeon]
MDAATILVAVFLASVALSVASSLLPYRSQGPVEDRVRKSTLLAGLFMVIAVSLPALFLLGLADVVGAAGLAALVAFFAFQYLVAPHLVVYGSQPASALGLGWLQETAERIAGSMGYKGRIQVRVAPSSEPNAYAVSALPASYIVVTTSLLDTLDRDEVEAVLAHEVGHLHHRDNGYLVATSTWLVALEALARGVIAYLRNIVESMTYMARMSTAYSPYYGLLYTVGLFLFLFIAAYISLIIAVVLAMIWLANQAVKAFSRTREHMADLYSARYTGDNRLIRSLEKIHKAYSRESTAREGKRSGRIVDPRRMLFIYPAFTSILETLASTHPSLEHRRLIVEEYLREKGAPAATS